MTYHFNQQGLSQRQSLLFHWQQGSLPITPILKDHRVVISVDGGRTRIRHANTGKRRHNSNRHGYKGEWIEPKLLTIYVVDQQGKRVNPTEIPVTNDGTYGYIYSITIRHILIQQEKSVLVTSNPKRMCRIVTGNRRGKLQPFLALLEMHLVRLGINGCISSVVSCRWSKLDLATYPTTIATPRLSALFNTRVT